MPRTRPPPPDFKRRSAKVGRKLAPANETKIDVKFGTLAVRAPPTAPPVVGDAASFRAALQHVRAAGAGARLDAPAQRGARARGARRGRRARRRRRRARG
jgi:hypothetical protein